MLYALPFFLSVGEAFLPRPSLEEAPFALTVGEVSLLRGCVIMDKLRMPLIFHRCGWFLVVLFLGSLSFPLALPAEVPISPIWSIQFSPDGKHLAVGTYQWIQLWDLKAKAVIKDFEPHAGAVRCLEFSGDGKTLFAGGGLPSQEGEVRIWNVETAELIDTLSPHGDTIEAIAVSDDDSKLLTASMDAAGVVISLSDREVTETLTQHVGRILAIDYRADGKYFATGSEDKSVKVWNPQTYEVLVSFDLNDDTVYTVSFSPEENIVVSGSADNAIRSWRIIESRRESGEIRTEGALNRVYNGHQGPIYSVDCGTWNNQVIFVSGSADALVIVWNLRSGNQEYNFNQSTDEVYAVDLSPDGQFVAAGGRDGIARIWSLADGSLIAELKQ